MEIDNTITCWPTTPIQRWFFEHDFVMPNRWNVSMLFTINETPDIAILRLAVGQLREKYHSLRLQIRQANGEWIQYLANTDDGEIFHTFDLSTLDSMQQAREMERLGNALHTSFVF